MRDASNIMKTQESQGMIFFFNIILLCMGTDALNMTYIMFSSLKPSELHCCPLNQSTCFVVVHRGTTMESRPKYSGFYHGIKSVFSDAGLSGLYRVR